MTKPSARKVTVSGTPDLYLDVDGVLLFMDKRENQWLIGMIQQARGFFGRIFWLSCWTSDGKAERLYEKHPAFRELKATPLKWNKLKTEALDWTRPFIWIEDGLLKEEMAFFKSKAVSGQDVYEITPGEHCENLIGRLKP